MPRRVPPLTDTQINKAKPQSKQVTLFDGGGLYLLVTPQGSKLWRFKYRFNRTNKLLSLGVYPAVSLADARKRRDDARKLIANDIDPSTAKKAQKQAGVDRMANSFEVVAREWHNVYKNQWTQGHAKNILGRMEREVFPYLGSMPIDDVKAPDVLKILKHIESRGILETAHRVKTIIGQVLRYAIAHGRRADRDCTADLKGALPPASTKHFAALTDPKAVASLLRAIDGFQGSFVVKCALQISSNVILPSGRTKGHGMDGGRP